MKRTHILFGLIGFSLLFGCQEQPTKETIGTGAGAVVGTVIGERVGDSTTGAVIGGIVGAVVGGEIGRRMDRQDRQNAYAALEANQPVSWENPDTDTDYTVTPTQTFRSEDDRLCRRYTTTIQVEGGAETAQGTACKRADGTWEIIS